MPLWAIVLTLVFSGLSLMGSVIGALWHARTSAKNSGRLEEKVDGLCRDLGLQREHVNKCQLAENCEREMEQLGDRIKSAHIRMDRHEGKINLQDTVIRELSASVAAVKAVVEAR